MDRIEKQVELRAPRSRVWKALTTAREFGAWFGVKLEGEFAPGKPISGKITYNGLTHLTMTVTVDRLEPEHTFSFRWNPYAIEPGVDYSKEEPTLVEFTLRETPSGTLLKVVESGFERVPLARRAKAFTMNDEGWAQQLRAIEEYLEHGPQ
ncbi:MAG TPA: SRPBCC family protein [Myxococcales bacterium]|jgi:uncharacterized protein YndB with AHSA1/START domain|nr:SRPBCC family protein [Myxococcales bacterium]